MARLIVGGLGVRDLRQITLETHEWLQRADVVLYLGPDVPSHLEQLKAWGSRGVRSLVSLYVDGDVDENNYRRLYDAVVRTASENAVTVLLVPGHPRVGVSVVQRLEKQRAELPFDLEVMPGVSSFDTMMNDLGLDPLERGSVLIDANRMLLYGTRWDPSMDCYIYHVCSVGTRRVHVSDARKDNAWHLLKERLRAIYPPDARVELVSSPTRSVDGTRRSSATIDSLDTLLHDVDFDTTLFIPGRKPQQIDRGFLLRLAERRREAQ